MSHETLGPDCRSAYVLMWLHVDEMNFGLMVKDDHRSHVHRASGDTPIPDEILRRGSRQVSAKADLATTTFMDFRSLSHLAQAVIAPAGPVLPPS